MTPTEELESGQVLNPVDVEREIHNIRRNMHRGVQIVTDADREKKDAQTAYDRAFARAFIGATCPQTEKKYHAELAVIAERDRLDLADVAYWYARKRAEAYAAELSALQSIGNWVQRMNGSFR